MMLVVSAEASFVVIGNANSPIKQLTVSQIKSLYLGKISNIQSQAIKGYDQPSQSAICGVLQNCLTGAHRKSVNIGHRMCFQGV